MSAAAPLEREVGSTIAGKYRLVRVLGRGGMGVVFEAEHTMTRRRVAVKVLHAHHRETGDAAKRFINEAQAAGKISHPNVVEVLDAGEDTDGSLYLVLELLTGHDLATSLMRQRRLEITESVTVVGQVLQALVVAHRQAIIHRDIKPENIFITRSVTGDTHIKILDFGISKAIGGTDGAALNVTQTNTTVGTPHYMSPEQARGERTIDTRADLWAVGVVLYECLAGKVPFDGESYNDQIVRVITEPHVPLSSFDVPEALSRIVDKALEKNRDRRYSRAEEMLADLRRFAEKHPEFCSVPSHMLREPAPPMESAPVARGNNPTVETQADPAFDPALPPADIRVPPASVRPGPMAGALPGLVDAPYEDQPTIVRPPMSEDQARHVVKSGARRASTRRVPSTPPRKNVWAVAILVIGVSLSIGSVATWFARRQMASAAPPAPAMTTLHFTGVPPGAQIFVGGVRFFSPDTAVLPRGARPTIVEITAPGVAPVHIDVVPDHDQTFPLRFVPTALPEPVPTAAEPDASAPVVAPAQPAEPAAEPAAPTTDAGATPEEPSTAMVIEPDEVPTAHAAAPEPAHTASAETRDRAGSHGGTISIRAQPACTISIDGQIRGRTPLMRLPFAPGHHRVLCRTVSGAIRSRDVTVIGGREAVLNFRR